MTEQTYNGYTNYETWNVSLWIDNDQGEHEYWIDRCACARSIHDLSEEMKDYFQENMPTVTGTYADLLQAALDSVNWYEIAENYWEEYHPEDSEDDESDED